MESPLITLLWSYPAALLLANLLGSIPVIIVQHMWKKHKMFPELNAKFSAFSRTDQKRWKTWRLYLTSSFLLGPLRFLIVWWMVFTILFGVLISMIGYKGNNAPIGRFRQLLITTALWLPSRIHMFMCGIVWYNYNWRNDKCYKKYLGPDW